MKNIGTLLAAGFLGLVLLAYMCTFQVRFTEVAIRKTFGQPSKEPCSEPGLYFKWPRPIQTVVKYDKRVQLLEDRTEETRTIDGKNVLLTTYALWRIADPSKFHTNFPLGVEYGERQLRTTVVTHKQGVTAQHGFNEFVSTEPSQRKIREIEQEMKRAIALDTRDQFGIEVVEFGIKKLALPESVTATIFESMKKHEETKASRYESEGNARAQSIISEAKASEQRILAATQKKVAEIETEAQSVVSQYYKEFTKHEQLRIYLDGLRTMEQSLQQRTTLIFDTNTFPWNLFSDSAREKFAIDAPAQTTPTNTTVERKGTNEPKQN